MLSHSTEQVWGGTDRVRGGDGRKRISDACMGIVGRTGVEAGSGTDAGETDRGGGLGVE